MRTVHTTRNALTVCNDMNSHVVHTCAVLTVHNDRTLHVLRTTCTVLTVRNVMTLRVVHVQRTVQRAPTPETADDNYCGEHQARADDYQCH